jgi:hypothetical protein
LPPFLHLTGFKNLSGVGKQSQQFLYFTFSRLFGLKKFLFGFWTVFLASRNFFNAEKLFFWLREISRLIKKRFSGFAKFLDR